MNDLNKITHTKVGDNIHYYVNGDEGRGVVVKMNNAYVSVLKGNGQIDEIHINDTFFIKDILANKTWNGMTMEERTQELQKAHAFSPMFLSKTWEDLPQELKDVLQKTNIEESTHGQIGGNRAGVSTDTDIKTPEDYKGETDDRDKQTKEEFKHDNDKPTVDKNNGMEEDHKKKDQIDGMNEDWRPTGGESDKQKNFLNKSEPLWKTWLEKDSLDGKGGSTPKDEPIAWSQGSGSIAARARKRITAGDSKRGIPKTGKAPKGVGTSTPKRGQKGYIQPNYANDLADASKRGREMGFPNYNPAYNTDGKVAQPQPKPDIESDEKPKIKLVNHSVKQYGKPLYGVTTLDKEGDGAGNSGVNSLETTGVYNARYSDDKGRYRDQSKDTEEKGEEKDDGRRSRD